MYDCLTTVFGVKMKLTKKQIINLINEEIEREDVLYIDVENILKEQKQDLDEGMFGSALKTLATNYLPGGRMVSDFARSEAFDAIDEKMEEFEQRLSALETGSQMRSDANQMDRETLAQLQSLLGQQT